MDINLKYINRALFAAQNSLQHASQGNAFCADDLFSAAIAIEMFSNNNKLSDTMASLLDDVRIYPYQHGFLPNQTGQEKAIVIVNKISDVQLELTNLRKNK